MSTSAAVAVAHSAATHDEQSAEIDIPVRYRLNRALGPQAFVLANALGFYLIRPGVPDLWAARARAFAAGHGVGLTYWFSWFGGSTPGDYSVLSPRLCSVLGTELVASLAAVVICSLTTFLVRGTRRPTAAAWAAAATITLNLWSGRVPFLLGAAFGLGAMVGVVNRRALLAAVLAVLAVLASPVAGVFLGVGLLGSLFTAPDRGRRAAALITGGTAGGALLSLGVIFGTPGPEPFPLYLLGEIVLVLAFLLLTAPPRALRCTLIACVAITAGVFAFPNGMGSNLARLVLFCLPPAAVALSRRRPPLLAALTVPILVLGALGSVSALRSAMQPDSSAAYYAPLTAELDALHGTVDHRLELVGAAHAASAVLIGHAVLARGWETQEDQALDGILLSPTLDQHEYRTWLDNNAVGYVAQDTGSVSSPEARVVDEAHPGFLHQIWSSAHWDLYQVRNATPIVAHPAVLEDSTQSTMTVHVPCACRTSIRVRWSKYLGASPHLPAGTADRIEDTYRPALGVDGSGWTTLSTNRSGTYVLSG